MNKINFFIDKNSISSVQLSEDAFGGLPDENNFERYNLENRLVLAVDAPAFSITQSVVLAIENQQNPSLINMALMPLNSFTAGLPILIFIYRGLRKSALLNGTDIKVEDSTWDGNNILKIIKNNQDKINQKLGTSEIAQSTSLGMQFGSLPNDKYIESLFFDNTDDFHPIIVPSGCQIGKFQGGTTTAGIEVLLDRVGYEPQLAILKSDKNVFSIEKLNVDGLTDKEKLRERFINRTIKEEILNHIDITAFYGSCRNQGINVVGLENDNTFLEKFYNKNSVYIDIRDERGFSYNHFYRYDDEINIALPENNGINYTLTPYYAKWPLLKITNSEFITSDKKIYLKIPLSGGIPENLNILSSLTKGVTLSIPKKSEQHFVLATQLRDGTIKLKESEPVALKNWTYTNNKLGANIFLLKKGVLGKNNSLEENNLIWDSFFSLNMNNFFGTTNIEDGEYRIKTYAPYNSNILADAQNNEVFLPTIGIAVDKFNITFFAFYDTNVFSETNNRYLPLMKLLGTGRYKLSLSDSEINYDPNNKGLGFLYQITKNQQINNYELLHSSFQRPEDNTTKEALIYAKLGEKETDLFFENFHAISITHQEYNVLKQIESNNPDFINQHPHYLTKNNSEYSSYQQFNFIESLISIGIPKLITTDDINYSIILTDNEEPIEINGESISMNGAIINNL